MPTLSPDHLLQTARENASLRDQFIARGLATAHQLDECGFVSHWQLDLWAEGGMLEEGVERLSEAWGLSLLKGAAFNLRIKRGEHGRFGGVTGGAAKDVDIDAPKGLDTGRVRVRAATHPDGASSPRIIRTVTGKRGGIKGKNYKVYATVPSSPTHSSEGDIPEGMTVDQARAESNARGDTREKLLAAGDKRAARLAAEARRRAVKAQKRGEPAAAKELHDEANKLEKSRADTSALVAHGQKEMYERRTRALNKRIEKSVSKAKRKGTLRQGPTPAAGAPRDEHTLTAAEAHFNDAGHVSQRTLLAYANEAASQPTTAEMYRNKDGSWDESRAALHGEIIDKLLRQRNKDRSFSATNDYLPSQEKPTVKFLGGAYASGKGGLGKLLRHEGRMPEDALSLDPDEIKAMLPEFQHGALSDPEANLRTYEEAWHIAQHAMAIAQEKHLNVVVDGITNTSAEEVAARIASFTKHGYVNPEIHYVSIPTEEAISRAKGRAAKGETAADRRMIPDVIMRAVHRDVSATIPHVMARSKEMGATVHVWDNFHPRDPVTGENAPPELVAQALPDGHVVHQNSEGFANVLNKATEQIPGVSEPQTAVQTLGGGTPIPTEAERQVGRALSKVRADTGNLRQPVRDQGELLARAQETQTHFAKLLTTLGEQLNSQVHDLSAGGDFAAVGQSVEQAPGTSHVIIAPVKSAAATASKMKQVTAMAGLPADDASLVHDAVRGTVTVPKGGDVPQIAQTLGKLLRSQGWQVAQIKNRLADDKGSTRSVTNGYGDFSLILRAPQSAGGLLTELQINTNPMWWMKEMGPGHSLFEEERNIRRSVAPGQRMSTAQRAQLQAIQAKARSLYDSAWAMALASGANDTNILKTTAQSLAEAVEGVILHFDETKHARGWHGRFADMLKKLPKPSLRGRGGGEVHLAGGHKVTRTKRGYHVQLANGHESTHDSAEDAASAVHDHVEGAKADARFAAWVEADKREQEATKKRLAAEKVASNLARTWYRFETPEDAAKIADSGELWGLPGHQGRDRDTPEARAKARAPSARAIESERKAGRVLIEFHTALAPNDEVGIPHHAWSPGKSRKAHPDLTTELKETKYGKTNAVVLRLHKIVVHPLDPADPVRVVHPKGSLLAPKRPEQALVPA